MSPLASIETPGHGHGVFDDLLVGILPKPK
jgi:hypothetical protein